MVTRNSAGAVDSWRVPSKTLSCSLLIDHLGGRGMVTPFPDAKDEWPAAGPDSTRWVRGRRDWPGHGGLGDAAEGGVDLQGVKERVLVARDEGVAAVEQLIEEPPAVTVELLVG